MSSISCQSHLPAPYHACTCTRSFKLREFTRARATFLHVPAFCTTGALANCERECVHALCCTLKVTRDGTNRVSLAASFLNLFLLFGAVFAFPAGICYTTTCNPASRAGLFLYWPPRAVHDPTACPFSVPDDMRPTSNPQSCAVAMRCFRACVCDVLHGRRVKQWSSTRSPSLASITSMSRQVSNHLDVSITSMSLWPLITSITSTSLTPRCFDITGLYHLDDLTGVLPLRFPRCARFLEPCTQPCTQSSHWRTPARSLPSPVHSAARCCCRIQAQHRRRQAALGGALRDV